MIIEPVYIVFKSLWNVGEVPRNFFFLLFFFFKFSKRKEMHSGVIYVISMFNGLSKRIMIIHMLWDHKELTWFHQDYII